jgi:hypothetical protein
MLNMDFVCDLGAGLIAMGEYQEALTLTMGAIDVQHRAENFCICPPCSR